MKIINILHITLPVIIFLSLIFLFEKSKNNKSIIKQNSNNYYVELNPCGNVYFKDVPNRILTNQETYNDILISFNKGNNIKAVGSFDKIYDNFYQDLNIKTNINKNNIIQISTARNTYDKELFYSINADVHHIDPIALSYTKGWNKDDINEISKNIGPFFANRYSIENKKPAFIKNYTFYNLNELNLKFGQVYKKEMLAKNINDFTDNFIQTIKDKLPKNIKGKRIAIVYLCKKGIVPFDSTSNGYGFAQYKIFNCVDAFKDSGIKTYAYEGNFGTMLDKESLLLANPDVIIINEGIYIDKKYNFFSRRTKLLLNEFEKMRKDPILKDIPAFKNNNIILGGIYDQGPIIRIYQIEMLAKQLYPEIFGKFNIDHKYPKNEQLFSREQLKEILLNE